MAFFDVDIGVLLRFTIYSGGKPLDLTGVQSVKLIVHSELKSPYLMTVDPSPTTGRATYKVLAGDFTPGAKSATVQVTFDAVNVFHSKTFELDIEKLFE